MSGYGQKLIHLWNDWQLSAVVLLSLTLQLLLLSTADLRRRTPPSWLSKAYFWVLYIGSRFIAPYALGILSRATNSDASAPTEAVQTPEQAMEIIDSARYLFRMFRVLFADGIFSFKERRHGQAKFSDPNARRAFKVVEIELSFVYDRLYTKASVSRTKVGLLIRVASLLLTLAGSLYPVVVTWHARQYKLLHRCITYTLLAGAVITDIVILVPRVFNIGSLLGRKWCSVKMVNRRRWSGYMAQSNLITFCLKKLPTESELLAFLRQLPRPDIRGALGPLTAAVTPPSLLGLVRFRAAVEQGLEVSDGFQKYFEQRSLFQQVRSRRFWKYYKQTKHVQVRDDLQDFIFKQLKKKESQFNDWERERRRKGRAGPSGSRGEAGGTSEQNREQVRNPVDARGDQVLGERKLDCLEWSIQEKEFDESLLIWHIATDLCFRQEDSSQQEGGPDDGPEIRETRKHVEMARALSNYMYYIMVVHPLMLSSSTTMATKRCKDTCAEARRHFLKKHIFATARSSASDSRRKEDVRANGKDDDKAVSEKNAHVSLLNVVKVTPLHASVVKGDKSKSVLWDGCFLACELAQIMGTDPTTKWRVICEVWVEMLCYAAVQCGGYQHAERLKEGGELITFVCLLMTHLGMAKHYRTEVGDEYPHLSPYYTA